MKYMHDLNFFSIPLKENFVMPNNSTSIDLQHSAAPLFWTYVHKDAENIVHDSILQWTVDKDLQIHTLNIFKTPPQFVAGIHIDGAVDYLVPAINWVQSGFESEQIYYKPIGNLTIADCLNLENEITYYRPFDESKLIEVERKKIIGPTLIRINVPHRVANYSNEWRTTISLRFESKSGKRYSWIEILKLFKDNLI